MRDVYLEDSLAPLQTAPLDADLARHLVVVRQLGGDCRGRLAPELWLDSVFHIASTTFQYLSPQETSLLSRRWRASDCYARLSVAEKDSLALFHAVGQRNAVDMAEIAGRLLTKSTQLGYDENKYLLGAGMLGYLAQHKPEDALRLWSRYGSRIQTADRPLSLMFRLLLAHSIHPDSGKQTHEVVANKNP